MSNPSPRPRQFDLIAFDWDGTLFDSTAIITRCIQRAVVDVGGQEPTREAASYVIGLGLMQALAHAAPAARVQPGADAVAGSVRRLDKHCDVGLPYS
jgi:phosphoglycolate phosphatase-like HAD superfamily hydrolase